MNMSPIIFKTIKIIWVIFFERILKKKSWDVTLKKAQRYNETLIVKSNFFESTSQSTEWETSKIFRNSSVYSTL